MYTKHERCTRVLFSIGWPLAANLITRVKIMLHYTAINATTTFLHRIPKDNTDILLRETEITIN